MDSEGHVSLSPVCGTRSLWRQGPELMQLCVRACVCVCMHVHVCACVYVVREVGSLALGPDVGGVGEAVGPGQGPVPLDSPEQ